MESLQWQFSPRPGSVEYLLSNRQSTIQKVNFIKENIKKIRHPKSKCCRTNDCQSVKSERIGVCKRFISDLNTKEQEQSSDEINASNFGTQISPELLQLEQKKSVPVSEAHDKLGKSNKNENVSDKHVHEKAWPPNEKPSYLSEKPTNPLIIKTINSPVKPCVPRASTARDVQFIRRSIDFVRANANAAFSTLPRQVSNCESNNFRRLKPGKLPAYLIRRRQEEANAEMELRIKEADDVPPGYRKMEEHERVNTLNQLEKVQQGILDELGRLPIRLDSLRIRRHRADLENKLTDIENTIITFSKPKVFVKLE